MPSASHNALLWALLLGLLGVSASSTLATVPTGQEDASDFLLVPYFLSVMRVDLSLKAGASLTDRDFLLVVDTAALIEKGLMDRACSDVAFLMNEAHVRSSVISDLGGTTNPPAALVSLHSLNHTLSFWLESGCRTTSTSYWIRLPLTDGAVFFPNETTNATLMFYHGYEARNGPDDLLAPLSVGDLSTYPKLGFGGKFFVVRDGVSGTGEGCEDAVMNETSLVGSNEAQHPVVPNTWKGVTSTPFPELFDSNNRIIRLHSVYAELHRGDPFNQHLHTGGAPQTSPPVNITSTVNLTLSSVVTTEEFYIATVDHTHEPRDLFGDPNNVLPDRLRVSLCVSPTPFSAIPRYSTIFRLDSSLDSLPSSWILANVSLFSDKVLELRESGDEDVGSSFVSGHSHRVNLGINRGTENPVQGVKTYCLDAGGAPNAAGTHSCSGCTTHHWTKDDFVLPPDHTPPPMVVSEFLTATTSAPLLPSMVILADDVPPLGWEEILHGTYLFPYGFRPDGGVYPLGDFNGSSKHEHFAEATMSVSLRSYDVSCIAGGIEVPFHHDHLVGGSFGKRGNIPKSVSFRGLRRKWAANAVLEVVAIESIRLRYSCFGVSHLEHSVCSSEAGVCIAENNCSCRATFYGPECEYFCSNSGFEQQSGEVWIDFGTRQTLVMDWYTDAAAGTFDCGKILPDCIDCNRGCRFDAEFLRIKRLVLTLSKVPAYLLLRLPVSDPHPYVNVTIFRYVAPGVVPNSGPDSIWPILGPVLGVLGFLVGVVIIVIVIVVVCGVNDRKQKRRLAKLDQIEHFDILLQEQEARKKREEAEGGVFAALEIKKDLFKVDYADVHLLSELGAGGSNSIVYKAKWKGQTVAYKQFKIMTMEDAGDFVDEFQREVSILGAYDSMVLANPFVLASVSHPNLMRFFGCCSCAPRIGILVEYCEKGDLMRFLGSDEGLRFPLDERIRLLREVASGMSHLHASGVIHRDLKAQNVLVTRTNVAKVMDFGLSKMLKTGGASDSANTKMTMRIGTSGYIAPEVVIGSGDYTNAVDVFSFAVLAYEVLSVDFHWARRLAGKRANIEFQMATAGLRPDLAKCVEKGVSPALCDEIRVMWSDDPKQRPTFDEVITILRPSGSEQKGLISKRWISSDEDSQAVTAEESEDHCQAQERKEEEESEGEIREDEAILVCKQELISVFEEWLAKLQRGKGRRKEQREDFPS